MPQAPDTQHVYKFSLGLHLYSTVQYHYDKCHSILLNISTSMFNRQNNHKYMMHIASVHLYRL